LTGVFLFGILITKEKSIDRRKAHYFYSLLITKEKTTEPLQLHNRRRVPRDLKRGEWQRGQGLVQEKSIN